MLPKPIKLLIFIALLSMTCFAQEVTLSNTVGLTLNSNFGGWSGDYFAEYYLPAADGWANSIDFNMSDLPDVPGGSISVAIFDANYPWDEIDTEQIADAASAAWLGYYANNGELGIVGNNWAFGGINYVDGADSSYQYDPLGEQFWPDTGMVDMPLYPNDLDEDTLTLDLENSEFGPFYFTRGEGFIVVVKVAGFEDQPATTEYRMGFRSGSITHDPQPCLKFYNTLANPVGHTGINDWGWYIRSYAWDWSVNAELSSCCEVRFRIDALQTTLSTDDREATATILVGNPSGYPSAFEARLHYTVNDVTLDVPMTGDDDLYTGVLPGQAPGIEVLYWVSVEFQDGDIWESEAYSYSVFLPSGAMLFVYDAVDLPADTAIYHYNFGLPESFVHDLDTWEARFGQITTELVDHYELIYHVMGGGPHNDALGYSNVYADWLVQGTVDYPKRLVISGQDYGVISGFADTTFPEEAFENYYLGIETLGPQDVGSWDMWNPNTQPFAINALENDSLTGFLLDYAGDSLQLYYDPYGELGFRNWIDNLTPSTGTVCFTDPGNSDAAVAVYNSGEGWKTAFWAIDPLALSYYDPIDTSSSYHYALSDVGNPLGPTFEWFGPRTQVDIDDSKADQFPSTFKLHSNFPNPFNPVTTIEYELPVKIDLTLRIFNMLGQEVATLVDVTREAGVHSVLWSGKDQDGHAVPSGVYFYTLRSDQFVSTQKMILLK